MAVRVLQGHVLDVLAGMPAKSVHVAVTSPPYWQLRAYGTPPQTWGDGRVCELGQEWSLDAFVGHLVEVFAAVGRVLRDDGTLWVNIADTYFSNPGGQNGEGGALSEKAKDARRTQGRIDRTGTEQGLKPGDLCMVPARFALAMQAAGWTLRSQIVLPKRAPMPESLQSTRWERCRIKLAKNKAVDPLGRGGQQQMLENPERHAGVNPDWLAEWADCPGCPKCDHPDPEQRGYVQRWGSWRPTSAYEVLYLFSKAGERYYADGEAAKVRAAESVQARAYLGKRPLTPGQVAIQREGIHGKTDSLSVYDRPERNLWNYVMWSPEPSSLQHYAAFPRFIPRLAIQAGTSEAGVCPTCGAPWLRVVDRKTAVSGRAPGSSEYSQRDARFVRGGAFTDAECATLAWRQSCRCPPHSPVPATCLDPFSGSGTTLIEANALGRHGIGIELQEKYVAIAHKRLSGQPLSLFAHEGQAEFEGGAEAVG
jgi:DNA modification methylase